MRKVLGQTYRVGNVHSRRTARDTQRTPALLTVITWVCYGMIKYPVELGIAVTVIAICMAFVIGVNILLQESE